MSRSEYYQALRTLAKQTREKYGITSEKVNLSLLRKIYKQEGIKIDSRTLKSRKIRAAYFCDDVDCSVLLNKNLPDIQRLFSLAHELKHHLVDRVQIKQGEIQCGDYNANEVIEIGAEVFAAELIYPEAHMRLDLQGLNVTPENCTPSAIVNFKRNCPASVSYKFIVKRCEWFGIIKKDAYASVHFQKLEEQLYGIPFYKTERFKSIRKFKQKITPP